MSNDLKCNVVYFHDDHYFGIGNNLHVRSSQSQSATNTTNIIAGFLMVKSGYAVLPIWSNFEVDMCIEELCLL